MTPRRTQTRLRRLIDLALWLLTTVLAAVTLAFSFGFSPPAGEAFIWADKFGHGLMYFATFFCFLLAAVWRPGRGDGPLPESGLYLAVAFVAAGLVVELLQEVTTVDRHAQLGDVLSEIIGAFGALAIHSWMQRRWGSSPG